jgi:hypothetical protein
MYPQVRPENTHESIGAERAAVSGCQAGLSTRPGQPQMTISWNLVKSTKVAVRITLRNMTKGTVSGF